jgi:type II secretory pathway component PulF
MPAQRVPSWVLALGVAMTAPPNIVLWFVVPRFADVFRDFGAEVPWYSQLWISAPWAGLAWTVLVALDAWRVRRRGGTVGFVLRAALGSFLLFGMIWISMYLPIFGLAATI